MANLDEFNKGLDALGTTPTEEAKASLKELLKSLNPEQRKKAEEEIRKRKLEGIFSDAQPGEKGPLFPRKEEKETREDTYSLEATEERIHSGLFKFALNRGNIGEIIEAKVKAVIPEEIFSTSKTTIQMVYLDKVINECKPGQLIYNQMMKLGGKAKSLFGGIFKPDGSIDFEGALKVGENLPESDKDDSSATKKEERVIESGKKAYELDSESKGVIERILSDAMEKYNENLKLLTAYAKNKPGFKELFDNPLILSKVLEDGKYEEGGVKIDITTKEFMYDVPPKGLESIQDTFVNQLIEKANGTQGDINKVLNHRKTFDKILGSLGLGSVKDIIVSILEMFGIGGFAGKGIDILEKMLDGKTDKEVYLGNLKSFLDSPRGKEVVSGKTDFSHKELKSFYKVLKNVNFDKEPIEGIEDKNLWAYLFTGKDSEGKPLSTIKNGNLFYLRKVIEEDIIARKAPINSEDLIKGINSLPTDWLDVKEDDERKKAIEKQDEEAKKLEEKNIAEEKGTLNNLIAKIESFIKINSDLNVNSKSQIERSVQKAREILEKTGVTFGELNKETQELTNDFNASQSSLGATPQVRPQAGTGADATVQSRDIPLSEPAMRDAGATAGETAIGAGAGAKSAEASQPENPFKDLPLITTIEGTEVRFESNKKYIILGDKAYAIGDIISDGKNQKNSVNLENVTFENEKLKIVFRFTDEKKREEIKELLEPFNGFLHPFLWREKELLNKDPERLRMYQEIAEKGTITFHIDPKGFGNTITQIKNSQLGKGEYKNLEEKLEVKIGWVPNP